MVSQGVRICFSKTGDLQFISHLDLCRTMRSALVRARLPVKYTEGFNPHIKMTFALPLSIGAQSECEYMDLVFTEETPESDCIARLQAQLCADIRILSALPPVHSYAEIGWAEYRIIFAHGQCEKDALCALFSQPLIVTKRTKRGDKDTDITPSIARFSVAELPSGALCLTALLQADNAGYLNPEYLAKATGAVDYDIVRTAVYLKDQITPFS